MRVEEVGTDTGRSRSREEGGRCYVGQKVELLKKKSWKPALYQPVYMGWKLLH